MCKHYGRWQPVGDQYQWACKVCFCEGSLACIDCKSGKKAGFEFDCDKYVKLCQEFSKERFFCDGDKVWPISGERLKRAEEERDYWKREAINAMHQMTRMAQSVVENCVVRTTEKKTKC